MHQFPRPAPKTASPVSSSRTNPSRTNNLREEGGFYHSHSRSTSSVPTYSDDGTTTSGGSGEVVSTTGPSKEATRKLEQIIQNFHTKAAIVILQSRLSLPVVMQTPDTKKVNKWFSLETDDTKAFYDDLYPWKVCDSTDNRPAPMVIETYIDTSDLTSKQALVVLDDHGKRWDVVEALNSFDDATDDNRPGERRTEVVLERWFIEMKEATGRPYDFASVLPIIYKKCIVFFRGLYTTAKFTPAWKFSKQLAKGGAGTNPLRLNCRILDGNGIRSDRFDSLSHPLHGGNSPVTTEFDLGYTDCPAGILTGRVVYRNDCNFRVDDSEAILSSQFMGADEHFFQPSLSARGDQRRRPKVEVGSLPANRQQDPSSEPTQAYGSMSTFHGNAPPLGSSPISALRAARMGSDTSSPPRGSTPRDRPTPQVSKSSLRSLEGGSLPRRSSLSYQPFKAGSLSSSPGPGTPFSMGENTQPSSISRAGGISALAQARNRSSLIVGNAASLRGVPNTPDPVIPSSSSPKPGSIPKYSSSFSHRRSRTSYGGSSKIDNDQGSSGKNSYASSLAQPGSGILAEVGSSGSIPTDDDNISDFLKLLDDKKTLRSFEPAQGGEAAAKRTSAQLSRFQSMRESNNQLGDSISSSMLLHRSSNSSSRQLSGIPPMVAATSLSISSSPGKPISPHTPHTPAIPSRLSANSIAEYAEPRRIRSRTAPESQIEDPAEEEAASGNGTNAIDIPTSPRPFYPHDRRSSSVAQQHRALIVDDDASDLPFGINRSISLGADSRSPPSLDALRNLSNTSATADMSEQTLQCSQPDEASVSMTRGLSSSLERDEGPLPPRGLGILPGSMNSPYRPRIGKTGGRAFTFHTGSSSSLGNTDRGSGSASAVSDRAAGSAAGRYSFTKPPPSTYDADDEPLLFDMSEIGRDGGRRSIEGDRGTANLERGYDSARGGDSGGSSRRGSRKGW